MTDNFAESEPGPGAGLGSRLRRVRTERGLSVRELARRAGCSASLVSQVERGVTAPSAGVVYALANELEISLDYLFGKDDDPVGQPILHTVSARSGHHPLPRVEPTIARAAWGRATGDDGKGVLQRGNDRNVIDLSSGVRWERLTPVHDQRVDFLEVVYAPFGRSSDDDGYVRHNGREYMLVLAGEIVADIGFATYELSVGDSLAFDPVSPHRFRNPGTAEARCMTMVVHEPT